MRKFLLIFFMLPLFSQAQTPVLDSIQEVINTTNSDSTRSYAYSTMAMKVVYQEREKADSLSRLAIGIAQKIKSPCLEGKALYVLGISWGLRVFPDSALTIFKRTEKAFEKCGNDEGLSNALSGQGIIYVDLGDFPNALKNYEKALNLMRKGNKEKRVSTILSNIGVVYTRKGDHPTALKYHLEALEIAERLKDNGRIASVSNFLGGLYLHMEEFDKAITNFNVMLDHSRNGGNSHMEAHALANLGTTYTANGKDHKAIEMFKEAIKIREDMGDNRGVIDIYGSMALSYEHIGELDKAASMIKDVLEFQREIGEADGIVRSLINLGRITIQQGDYVQARLYCTDGYKRAQNLGSLSYVMETCACMYEVEEHDGNFKASLEYYKESITARDSITGDSKTKELTELEMQFQFDQQQYQDSLLRLEQAKIEELERHEEKKIQEIKHEQEVEQQKSYMYAGVAGGVLMLFIAFVLFRSNRQKKKNNLELEEKNGLITRQKDQVEHQKLIVEQKNSEILDSINYAKRIQSAILPPSKLVKEYLNQSFILYKPKDIVAGDFYWMEPSEKGVLFAAADCTGHGVPGAMVSVVCNNGLNRSVREYGLTDPGQILDKTREIVIAEFEKSEEEVKDGMDIALCSLHERTLKYAGAHNPLWIIRKGSTEVEEIRADKQPIGKYAEPKPYTTNTIELQEGDSFYIFSDGYADQFGGQRGKKYKTANFKRLLLSIQNETIEMQKQLIDEAFEAWKGWGAQPLEQLDDVCVIGVRV